MAHIVASSIDKLKFLLGEVCTTSLFVYTTPTGVRCETDLITQEQVDNVTDAELAEYITAQEDEKVRKARRAEFSTDSYLALQGKVQREETPLQDLKDETARIRTENPYSYEV